MSITQRRLQSRILPLIKDSGDLCRKSKPVHARLADESETVVSIIDGKKETENVAAKGDYVVKNLTASEERYIVSKAKFPKLYEFSKPVDERWGEYLPQGRVLALELSDSLWDSLETRGQELTIVASWGEQQHLQYGDYLVSPVPALDEVYGIARSAFEETYEPVTGDTND